MNWTLTGVNGNQYGDGSRLRRTLGMRPDNTLDSRYNKKYRERTNIGLADQILKAIDRELWEFDS